MCGANLSYYEICERNMKVWIPFIPWDSQLCIIIQLWLTQTKLFDMCMWTKLSTKITTKILNKIKKFPAYLMGFLGHETPNKNIFKTGLMAHLSKPTRWLACQEGKPRMLIQNNLRWEDYTKNVSGGDFLYSPFTKYVNETWRYEFPSFLLWE